jgi:CubicO group peptidase (beta-lactamase class C family)
LISILAILIGLIVLLVPSGPESAVREVVRDYGIPGATLAYGPAGEEPVVKAFGNMRSDQVLPIASLSKTITSEAIMKLADEGKLRIDRHVLRLLQHEGGFDRLRNPADDCTPSTPDFKPGIRSAYSNKNYCELGRIIEATTGKSYEASVKALLPMTGFQMAVPRFGAAGGWAANARTVFFFFSRPPHSTTAPYVRPADYIPPYRAGWMRFHHGWGHWGNFSPPINVMSIAVHCDDGLVMVALFDGRPADYKRALNDVADRLRCS